MGMCWSSGRDSLTRETPQSLPKNPEAKRQQMRIDQANPLMLSYSYLQKNVFEKNVYDWRSIPIITELDLRNRAYFEVKNRGIKNCNFVVGIIKKSAIRLNIGLPWKTNYCVCYESHQKNGESGIVYQGKIDKNGSGIQKDQSIRVIVSLQTLEFRSNGVLLARRSIPSGFLNDQILPYVALFNKGDRIQIVNDLVFLDKKQAKQ